MLGLEATPANLVGMVAVVITTTALLRRNNDGLLFMLGVGVSLWAVHYWLLGTVPGAIVHGIAAVSIFLANALQFHSFGLRACVGVLCSIGGVTASVVFGSSIADVVAAIGCVVMTMTQYLGRGVTMRIGFLGGEGIFLVFAVLVGSVPGVAVTLANFAAGAVGLVKMSRAVRPVLSSD